MRQITAIRPGRAAHNPANGPRRLARSIARRAAGVVTDARRTRPIGAARRGLQAGDPLRRTARPPAGAAPSAEDHARKKPRNALIRFKTGAKMARSAQTRETPQTTALPGDGPEPGSPGVCQSHKSKVAPEPFDKAQNQLENGRARSDQRDAAGHGARRRRPPPFRYRCTGEETQPTALSSPAHQRGGGDHAKHGGGGAGRQAPAWQSHKIENGAGTL